MFANSLITISSSDDDSPSPKLTIRRTPKMEDIPSLIADTPIPKPTNKSPIRKPTKKSPRPKSNYKIPRLAPTKQSAVISDDEDKTASNSSEDKTKKNQQESPMASVVNAAFKQLGLHGKTPTKITKRIKTTETHHQTGRHSPRFSSPSGTPPPPSYPHVQELFDKPQGITIAVEGNIGIGKTTFLQKIRYISNAHITTIREPLEQWTRNNHINLLSKMYSNPKKWAFIFQTVALANLLQNHVYTTKNKLMERSLGAAYHVFLRAHHDNRTLKHRESMALQHWCETAAEIFPITPDVIIYLRAAPKIALERIRTRGRNEERSITIDYINQLHSFYDDWLLKTNTKSRVIILNADQSCTNMLDDLNTQLGQF